MIPLYKVLMAPQVVEGLKETLYSGYIGQDKEVELFEDLLSTTFLWSNVLTVNSCTSALQLAFHLIKPRVKRSSSLRGFTEVLLPPLSCFASVSSVLQAGLQPRWVDIDPTTLNMDLDDLERKLQPSTLAVLVVHFAGMPVDLARLTYILDEHEAQNGCRPYVIEDCAQALGSQYGGHYIGSPFNHIFCFGFGAIKFLTTGDGGAIVLPDKELYRRAKLLRWYGLSRDDVDIQEQNIQEAGFKYHMNDIAATIGLENLIYIKNGNMLDKQRHRYLQCVKELDDVSGVQVCYHLRTCGIPHPCSNQFPLMVDDRRGFEARMNRLKIECSPAHYRCDVHECVKEFRTELPGMDEVEEKMTLIPIGWWLSEDQFQYVIESVRNETRIDWAKEGF